MNYGIVLGNCSVVAGRVVSALESLQGFLDASMDPERMAMRHLGVDRMGSVRMAYCKEAFDLWAKVLKKDPNDINTIHHLAIMHHARAIDLEAGEQPADSNPDWEAALSYWTRLSANQEFWNSLAHKACKQMKRDAAEELRRKFPELYLQMHYDVAFTDGRKKYRAKYHIQLAARSAFAADAKAAAHRETYTRFISRVPDTVWQIDTLDSTLIKQGTDAIEQYLTIAPDCLPALEDAVRLQHRLLRARYTELQAAGEDNSVRSRLLALLKKDADHWKPYFDQVVKVISDVDNDVRQKLTLWYRVMGDIHAALSQRQESLPYYEQGVAGAAADDDERLRCSQLIGEVLAWVAREQVLARASSSRESCDKVRARDNLSVSAHFLLANAYLLLNEFDIADEVCKTGMVIEPDINNLEGMEVHERDRAALLEMRDSIRKARQQHQAEQLTKSATEQMKKQDYHGAVDLLNRAIATHSESIIAFYMRAQALLGLWNLEACQKDVAVVRQRGREAPKDFLDQVNQLEAELNRRTTVVRKFGADAARLRHEASSSEDASIAETKLREAFQRVSASGRAELGRELADLLAGLAIQSVNEGFKTSADDSEKLLSICQSACGKLEEAGRLHPGDKRVDENLKTVGEIEKRYREEAARVKRFGREAVKLVNESVEAFQKKDYDRAGTLFRQAVLRCSRSGRSELEKELATALFAIGAEMAHLVLDENRTEKETRIIKAALANIDEACRMAPGDQDMRRQGDAIRQQLDDLSVFGREGIALRRSAIQAFNQGQFGEAEDQLRKALGICSSAAHPALRKELSTVLSNAAVVKANASNGNSRVLQEAQGMLQEALTLDPSNDHARTNLDAIANRGSPEQIVEQLWPLLRKQMPFSPDEWECKELLKLCVEVCQNDPQKVVEMFAACMQADPGKYRG